MGSSVNPADFMSRPDPALSAAQLAMQSQLGNQQMAAQNRMLGFAAQMPLESWTPDIWGQEGMSTKAAQIAAINAYKSRDLEQRLNPALAQLRQTLPAMVQNEVTGNNWQQQMDQWAKHQGLVGLLGSGQQDSTIGKSAYFDAATQEGQALRRAQLQNAAQFLGANQAPSVGIDVGSTLGAEQSARAQGMQQRAGFRDALMGRTQGAMQSTTDWISQMMSSTNSAAEAYKKDWQGYQQAMLQGAQENANRTNALVGAGISAAGSVAGGALGCWVAREIYGTETGTWKVVRHWVFTDTPKWFQKAYLRFGERVAKFICDKPVLKSAIRLIMDAGIRKTLA
jgi:hypothetical protein